MSTGERPVVNGEREEHVLVVNWARALDEVFEKANQEKVQKGSE